jgi:L-iditol 2-dehydrogenase
VNNRAAVMNSLGSIDIMERADPHPGPRDVVIEVMAVGICGSDIAYFRYGAIGDWVVTGPIVLGHEASGLIIECGSEVKRFVPGDRVAIEPGTPCRLCKQCRVGAYHLCSDLVFLATPPYDGALVQKLVMNEQCAFPIPASLSFEDGALAEPLSVGLWACRRAKMRAGDSVLVTGAGPVGILAASAALALGATRATLVDPSAFRRELADSLGFPTEEPHSPLSSPTEFDVVLECSGADGALSDAIRRLGPGGRAAVVGLSKSESVSLPLTKLLSKEISLSLVHRYAHTWPTAIALLADGRVATTGLITHRFPLDETEDALTLSSRLESSMKVMVEPQAV